MRAKSGSGSFTDENPKSPRGWSRSRTLSVSYQAGTAGATSAPGGTLSPGDNRKGSFTIAEEVTLDYTEINAIPPLPLWTLLAADKESGSSSTSRKEGGEV